ncbi:bifunctional aspartate kinase/homoserine dehydrogenase I [Flavobacteriaceae bacterium F08102]|nr:bifunctional aspartate kinase/homoserine dehydrogenase I [Flavobacteriaceae bacterium F08102]
MSKLEFLKIDQYQTLNGTVVDLSLSYQLFGKPLHTAPIVLVNHALTGNSNVAGEGGWWTDLVGEGKVIDTNTYTVLAFNIPGNGYDGFLLENYKDFVARDIAAIFLKGLQALNVHRLFAMIGGSLGGGIAWEMAVMEPDLCEHLIPVASDWKATDWLIANCQIQEQFLTNSSKPLHDARMHAMLCYRTPASFKERFQRSMNTDADIFNVESWLLHHGNKLEERFQLSAYKLMNQLLKTIDVTKGRDGDVLAKIKSNIHIIAVDSDLFFTAEENRETQRIMSLTHPNISYEEINSVHGHDAFLIEFDQLEKIVTPIFKPQANRHLNVIKFGGKSLANGKGIERVVQILEEKIQANERMIVVVSARGNTTDQLVDLAELAQRGEDYTVALEALKKYQFADFTDLDFEQEFAVIDKLLSGIALLKDCGKKIKDQLLAQGELLSAKFLVHALKKKGINAEAIDARNLIKTDENFGNAQPINTLSKANAIEVLGGLEHLAIVTGFIGSNEQNETTTLGRNGSNYTASLLANYLNAVELQNYTHVNGIYTANPDWVSDAKKITELSFEEANELANFGTNVLHAKTIIPLIEKNINLRILNTFNPEDKGTLITANPSVKGVKSLSVLDRISLINFEGRGLLGKSGVDARIFKALSIQDISVSIISQGSSERGIGLIVDADQAEKAIKALHREFEQDFYTHDVHKISVVDQLAAISMVGLDLSEFHKPYSALIENQIIPLLFNNTITGKNVSIVLRKSDLLKAINVIHSEIFGIAKHINIAIFGHGLVGGTLLDQMIASAPEIEKRKGIKLNVFAVANSRKVLLKARGIDQEWKKELAEQGQPYTLDQIIEFASDHHLENLVAVDNTASQEFVQAYTTLVEHGFDLVSSNKIANTIGIDFYDNLREKLSLHKKKYLYETNVGAGLPLIDTIKLLHLSGENITRIRGVFSGSLSFLFNHFSVKDQAFSEILSEAMEAGYTEPDPREDLCGNDVARKLLILARELDLKNELVDIDIDNLIPVALRDLSADEFTSNLEALDAHYEAIKEAQEEGCVLRYIGDLHGDLSREDGAIMEVKLCSVPADSPIGQVKGSDSIFEIYTESYGDRPIVIQGAGAGAEVTARGVFGDILRITGKI